MGTSSMHYINRHTIFTANTKQKYNFNIGFIRRDFRYGADRVEAQRLCIGGNGQFCRQLWTGSNSCFVTIKLQIAITIDKGE